MAALYEIASELTALFDMMDDPDVDVMALADTLEGVKMELEDKAVGYAAVIKNAEADSNALNTEIRRLKAKKDAIDNHIAYLKESLYTALKAAEITKVDKDPRFKIAIQKNGGVAPLVITGDVPKDFLIAQDPIPDTKAIRKYVEAFGCDWAHFGERGESLRIK